MTQNHYMDNKEVYGDICIWKLKTYIFGKEEKYKNKVKIPDEIGSAVVKIGENVAKLGNFREYTYLDEMIADGVVTIISGLENFNERKYDSPFSYFSRSVKNAFLQRREKEQKARLAMLNGNYEDMYYEEDSDDGEEVVIDEETIQDLNQKRSKIYDSINRKKERKKIQKKKREITSLSMFLTGGKIKDELEKDLQKTETFYNNSTRIMGKYGSMIISVEKIKESLGIEMGTIDVSDVLYFLEEVREYPIEEGKFHGCSDIEITFKDIEGKDFVVVRWSDEENYGY